MKLSAKNIDKLTLAPGKSELVKSSDDCPGLRFRIRDNGWRGWEFKFGKLPRIPLGKYPAVSVMQAHDKAREYYFKAKQGGNPAQEIAEAKARRDETFGAAVEIYLQRRQSEFRPRSLRDVTRHLTVNLTALKKLSIAAVDRRSIRGDGWNRGCGRLSFFLFETLQIWRLSGHHFGSVSIIQ
jgi:hypothetical protein